MTHATLVGLSIGDALGMPFERRTDVDPKLQSWDTTYLPSDRLKLPPGHGTDDTDMAVCLAESLIAQGRFVDVDVAQRYLAWADGTPYGMGGITRKAMDRFRAGDYTGVPIENPHAVGNGTAMRVAPLGVWAPRAQLGTLAAADALLTHAHIEAAAGSVAIAWAVRHSLDGRTGAELIDAVLCELTGPYLPTHTRAAIEMAYRMLDLNLRPFVAIGILGRRGNVIQTVSSALYCAARVDKFIDGVLIAIRGGGDTDTRGAIAGAILGARYGLDGIPPYYKDELFDVERLMALDAALVKGA